MREQERAELAARVHDSVLQTLTLIQKDPADARKLARRQERELRAWLYPDREPAAGGTLAGAVEAAAAEIEELHGVRVDVVRTGDAPLDERLAGTRARRARGDGERRAPRRRRRGLGVPRRRQRRRLALRARPRRRLRPRRGRRPTAAASPSRFAAGWSAWVEPRGSSRRRARAPKWSWSSHEQAAASRRARRRPRSVPRRRARRARRDASRSSARRAPCSRRCR